MSERAWAAEVAAGATTVWERLAVGARARPDRDGLRDERWEHWTSLVGAGEPARIERRLAWDGLRPRDVRPLLGPVALPDGAARWSPVGLPGRLEEARAVGVGDGHPALRASQPLPFEAAWLPLVIVESARLRRRLPDGREKRLGPSAWAALERSLLRSLCMAGASTIARELRIRREATGTALTRLLAPPNGAAASAFTRELVDGGLFELLRDAPGLARLVATLAAQWRRQVRLLLARVVEDADAVAERLGVDLRRVEHLTTDLSDRHDGGATVIRLFGAGGRSVVYKPRDAALEAALAALLDELGAETALPRAPAIVLRKHHAWVEDVRPAALADAGAAARYHRRAGGLLALLHLLHGNDAHLENLVAAGEHPVLVDGETILGPARHGAPARAGGPATRAAWDRLDTSVLRTGLLPRWVPRGESGYDSGGLGPAWVQRAGIHAVRWRDGDVPSLEVEREDLQPGAHVPRLAGRPVGAEEHVEDVIAGFLDVARALARRPERDRVALLAPFTGGSARVLPRATALYGMALLASVDAGALADGAARSIVLDGVHAAAAAESEPPPGWPLARAERAALERLDVPRVTVSVDRVPARLRAVWSTPGLTIARERLGSPDLAHEVSLIEAAFYARVAAADDEDQVRWKAAVRGAALEPAGPVPASPLDESTAETEAERIAALLLREAVRGHDGSLTWVAPVIVHGAQGFTVGPVGARLYDGAVGIALFFGALARVTGSAGHAETARATLRELVDDPTRAVAGLPPGGVTGAASVVWGLVRLADLLDQPELVRTACVAAEAVTPARLKQDRLFDLSGGNAGALLAFLRLHAATGEEEWLDRARRCGDLLLEHRAGSPAAWPRGDGPSLTGLSHGAAGIAHALFSLSTLSGDRGYADAAHEAIRYERLHFVPEFGNWEDLRPGGPATGPNVMHAWCNGAPGIGLARLPWRAVDELAAADVETAIETTRAHAFGAVDHLCCGTLGRVELLLRAGDALHRPALIGEARTVAGQVVARARRTGRYRVSSPELPPVSVPGLFRGVAGIGLQLLRLARPDHVPSPLLLD